MMQQGQPMMQQGQPMMQQGQPMMQQVPPMNQQVPPMMQGVSPMQPMMQGVSPMQPMMNQPMQQPQMQQPQMQQPQQPQNQVVYPPQQGGLPVPNLGTIMQGGFLPSSFPGQGGMIVVDTSGGAMAAEGLGPMVSGGRRTRASYQGGGGMNMGPPSMPSMPSMPSGGFQNITINKME